MIGFCITGPPRPDRIAHRATARGDPIQFGIGILHEPRQLLAIANQFLRLPQRCLKSR